MISQLKCVPQISLLTEVIVTHLRYKYLMSTPINSKYALFAEYNRKFFQNREVGSRRVKGKNHTAFAVIYTYRLTSWVVALKRQSVSSVKRLLWSHLEKQNPNSSVRLCIALTHNDQTRMIIHVHTIYRGLEHAGHQL